MQRDSAAALTKLANKIASLLPARGSSLCARYIVVESLLQLFRRVREGGGDVAPIGASLSTILSQLADAVGAADPGAGHAGHACGRPDSDAASSAPARPEIDGAGELLLCLLERSAALVRALPTSPSSGTGDASLLCAPLLRVARRAPPHYAAAALRVVDAALDAALSSPLVDASGGGGGGGEEIDQFAAMDALDDAAMEAAAKVGAFGEELKVVLREAWRGGDVLHERLQARPATDVAAWRRAAREAVELWARIQAFLLRDLALETQVRELAKLREQQGLLRPDYAGRFFGGRSPDEDGRRRGGRRGASSPPLHAHRRHGIGARPTREEARAG